jgi:hypothetical protein
MAAAFVDPNREAEMDVKAELNNQITGALAGAEFPIASPEALLAAFPNGADTTCEAGDVELRAGDAGGVLTPDDFPFVSAQQVADAIVDRAVG